MTFTILNKEKQYQGHAFDVAKVHAKLPNGKERDYDLVQHSDSIAIVPVDDKGRIYFVSQYRIGSECDLLELPAGVMETGETPLECAEREVREEIGLAAEKMQALGGFYLAAGYANEYMTVFLAQGLYEAPLAPDADEFLNVVSFSIEEAYQMARAGKFADSKSLAALLLAEKFLLPVK
ncbi:MAG: NUDIX hydrolase [Anaerolineaceae bacterium]|nr:NUDIX hydrolase [Anaerolineaceae bacterium]